MECETCLTDPDGKPAFSGLSLRGLAPNSTAFAANTLLRVGASQSWWFSNGEYSTWRDRRNLLIKHHPWPSEDVSMFGNRTLGPRAPDFVAVTERFVAHITARLPLATIIGADVSLPKVTKVEGASEQPFVTMTLQVRWDRAIAVLAAIWGGEILAVAGLFGWCLWKRVLVRDHASYLSVANLVRPALDKAAGITEIRSVDSGVEIARKMEKWGVARLRYQAATGADGCLEVSMLDRGAPRDAGGNGRFVDGRHR